MISIFLFSIWNGLSILWQQNIDGKEELWSKRWHLVGRLCILAIVIDLLLFQNIISNIGLFKYLFIVFNLSWTVYNFIINIVRKWGGTPISIFHIGSGGFDGALRKYLSVAQIWVLGLVLILISFIL